jgi:hypothetical protein
MVCNSTVVHEVPFLWSEAKSWGGSASVITRAQVGLLGFDFWEGQRRDFSLFNTTFIWL